MIFGFCGTAHVKMNTFMSCSTKNTDLSEQIIKMWYFRSLFSWDIGSYLWFLWNSSCVITKSWVVLQEQRFLIIFITDDNMVPAHLTPGYSLVATGFCGTAHVHWTFMSCSTKNNGHWYLFVRYATVEQLFIKSASTLLLLDQPLYL